MKLMSGKRCASVIALLWLLTISFGSIFVKAQPPEGVVVGVKVGDWIRYGNISVTWNATVIEPEPDLIELNNTLWFENEVVDIAADTIIIFEQTTRFKNASEKTAFFHVDIYNGDGNDTLMFVNSGVSANDLVYPGLSIPLWINETIQRVHAGALREVNRVSLSDTQPTEEEPAKSIDVSIDYFWDKETGVLTARSGGGVYLDESGNHLATWLMSEEVIDTNLWSPPEKEDDETDEFPYTIVALVAIIIIILVMAWRLVPRKRRVKRRKPR